MDSKQQSIRKEISEKQKQLEVMVRQGIPLTDPRVVAVSQDIDRLVLLISTDEVHPSEDK